MINLKNQRLLVIAPHPDDEVIGCGGLIAKIKNAGGKVYVLYLTVGDTRDFTKKGLSTAKERVAEIQKVARFLKLDKYDIALLGNNYHLRLDVLGQKALMDIIERTSKVSIEKIKPTIVAFTSPNSYNQDHAIAAKATHAALRPAPAKAKHFVDTVLSYEESADQWALEESPNVNFFVPLSKAEVDKKMKALKLYKSQDRPAPNLRSLSVQKNLASLRGAQCGKSFAEAYICLRTTSE